MQTAAVLPAFGIGDALLMMIASHQLKMEGYHVTTFHDALPELQSWFPGHDLKPNLSPEKYLDTLASFDLILVENDNSAKIKQLAAAFRHSLSIFYPTYSAQKHSPLSSLDRVFNKAIPMADNIAEASASLLGLSSISKANGLKPLNELIHRKNKQRIVLHPTSREVDKNWKSSGFLKVAHQLKKRNFSPVFCVGPKERIDWNFVECQGFELADLTTLSSLAVLIFESGFVIGNDSLAGHLASNLQIPTVIVANDEKRMRLWRPGWLKGQVVLPPPYLPNWKFLRLKERNWQHFITPNRVLEAVLKLANPDFL